MQGQVQQQLHSSVNQVQMSGTNVILKMNDIQQLSTVGK